MRNQNIDIDDFIWLPDVIEKLSVKHQVTLYEIEEIFFDRPKYRFVECGYHSGEDVYSTCGQTESGRYLAVIFIIKPGNTALIITARDID